MPTATLTRTDRPSRRLGQLARVHVARARWRLAALYGQLVDPRRRLLQLLRAFDRQFDTAFFAGKSYTDIHYCERHLDEQLLQWGIPRSVIQDICRYCEEHYWRLEQTRLYATG